MDKTIRRIWRARLAEHGKLLGRTAIALFAIGYVAYIAFFEVSDFNAASAESNSLKAGKYHMVALMATARMVQGMHLDFPEINNETSVDILDNYLDSLDPQKIYFLQSDIDEFQSNRFYFDDYLIRGNLNEVFRIFERYRERVADRTDYAMSLVDYPFNFDLNDQLLDDRSEADWPQSQEEYDWLWKRLVKDDFLTLMLERGDEDTITKSLKSRYSTRQQTVFQYKADDVTELFLNSYLTRLDPYSAYFSSNSSEDLEISLSQQIEGIGAMLRREDEYTVVHSLIAGGPALRSNLIHAGDRIVAVKDKTDQFMYVVGWRLSDVVDLIRGPKGTKVHMQILPKDALPNAAPKEISIVREQVKIEEQMAKKSTVEIEANGRLLQLGVISLPTFYANFLSRDNQDSMRSSARDVAQLVEQLKSQDIDGIVLDLRGNGGGALNEAVDLTSLFIESGPIVQVKSTDGELEVKYDSVDDVIYSGPLVVLVDRRSASGSEIFAAAVQDYGRGVVIGETTFGKGMLQTIWPLDKVVRVENTGMLKLSTAQFYRVSGISTQYLGVVPDIRFATDEFAQNSGGRSLENSSPGSVIDRAKAFSAWPDAPKLRMLLPELDRLSRERTQYNPVVAYLVERERNNQQRLENPIIHLNKDKRQAVLDDARKEELETLNRLRLSLGLPTATELNEETIPSELIDDAFLDEALNVLVDLIVQT